MESLHSVNSNAALGIDIGGTKISMGILIGGEIKSRIITAKTPCTKEEILEKILEGVETLTKEYKVQAIGIATAGAVNKDNTRVIGSTGNLPKGYSEIDFKNEIEKKFGIKTLLENDANAAAYAEYKAGAAVGHKNTIVVTLGTGVGGGIIAEGMLIRGKSGAGAEVGHMPISWRKERSCTCGDWDCWESYASGTGYAVTAREIAKKTPPGSRTGVIKEKDIATLTTHDIILGVYHGDEFCKQVHEAWVEFVLCGLINLVNVFDPESIVLSGGMAKFIDFDDLNIRLDKRCHIAKTIIIPAKAENNAGIIGAAMLAAEKFFDT